MNFISPHNNISISVTTMVQDNGGEKNGFNENDGNLQHNFMHGTPDLNKLRVSRNETAAPAFAIWWNAYYVNVSCVVGKCR